MYDYRATIAKVVDGDTLHLTIDLGLDIYTQMTVRLSGIDAPEIRTPEGQAAYSFVQDWIDRYAPLLEVTLHTVKDRREKYGRYLGIVESSGQSLNNDLLISGNAKAYDGGPR